MFKIYLFYCFVLRKRWFSHLYTVIQNDFLLTGVVWIFLDWNFQVRVFTDLAALDFLVFKNRFLVVYQFLSLLYHTRYFFLFGCMN